MGILKVLSISFSAGIVAALLANVGLRLLLEPMEQWRQKHLPHTAPAQTGGAARIAH